MSVLNAKADKLIVFNPEDMFCAYFGDLEAPDVLKAFVEEAKKLQPNPVATSPRL